MSSPQQPKNCLPPLSWRQRRICTSNHKRRTNNDRVKTHDELAVATALPDAAYAAEDDADPIMSDEAAEASEGTPTKTPEDTADATALAAEGSRLEVTFEIPVWIADPAA